MNSLTYWNKYTSGKIINQGEYMEYQFRNINSFKSFTSEAHKQNAPLVGAFCLTIGL